jgi:hypothetical protein
VLVWPTRSLRWSARGATLIRASRLRRLRRGCTADRRCVVFTSTVVASSGRRRGRRLRRDVHRCEDFDLWLRLALRGAALHPRGPRPAAAAPSSQSAAPA